MAKLERSRNFANKLWNAARFIVARQPADDGAAPAAVGGAATLPERWIRSRLAATTADATRRLDRLDLGAYAAAVSEFAWSDLCDWYLEVAKVELNDPERPADARRAWATGLEVLVDTLCLLHPVMPFVTEEIWSVLPSSPAGSELLMTAPWPDAGRRDSEAEVEFEAIVEVIRTARNLRTDAGVAAGATVTLHLAPAGDTAVASLEAGRRWIEPMARVRLEITKPDRPASGVTIQAATATALGAVWLGEDAARPAGGEAAREDQHEILRQNRDRLRALLADPGFSSKAPPAVVERERERLADVEDRLRQLGGAAKDAG
jgi:valyl-tRNA synthetase